MNITFGLVVYNEEKFIKRVLESIVPVADEIILIHDGPCDDKTLEIANTYGVKTIVGERLGGSDPHRITILEQARNEWVFMIDADEYLSPELKLALQNNTIKITNDLGAISVKWPIWDGTEYVTVGNNRPVMFRRSMAWAVGLHNTSTHTVGETLYTPYILEHKPAHSNVSGPHVAKKLCKRVVRDATQFLKGPDGLPWFHRELADESFVRDWQLLLAHPRIMAYYRYITFFLGSMKNTYKDGLQGIKISLIQAKYQFDLAQQIWKQQQQKNQE